MIDAATFPAGNRFITAAELDARDARLQKQLDEGFAVLGEDLRKTRHQINESVQKVVGQSNMNEYRIVQLEAHTERRRWTKPAIIGAVGLSITAGFGVAQLLLAIVKIFKP